MERRSAIIAAAGASLTLLAGAAAIGINTQLVSASDNDGVGEISPIGATEAPTETIYVDDPAAPAPAPAQDDDEYEDREDDGYEDHEDEDGPEEQEQEHEYEGAEDDD
jgi:hypothetical protein